jgi:hypothetical protein
VKTKIKERIAALEVQATLGQERLRKLDGEREQVIVTLNAIQGALAELRDLIEPKPEGK